MSADFPRVLAEHLRCYREILEAARDLVGVLERESFDRLEAFQARRQAAMDRIDAMGPVPANLRGTLREVLSPLLIEAQNLDARAEALLDEYRARVFAKVAALPLLPDPLPPEVARYLDMHG